VNVLSVKSCLKDILFFLEVSRGVMNDILKHLASYTYILPGELSWRLEVSEVLIAPYRSPTAKFNVLPKTLRKACMFASCFTHLLS
jgi:hypothetical protein